MSIEIPQDPYDLALKTVARAAPWVFFRVAGLPAEPSTVRFEDSGVIVKELHADTVLIQEDATGEPPFGLCLEYVWQFDRDRLRGWILKALTLEEKLGCTVLLIVIYLRPAPPSQLPMRLVRTAAGKSNDDGFETVHLWEFADQIRCGAFPELAPFLILWEHEDAEGTLRDEKELIEASGLPEPVRREVLGAAYLLGLKYASRHVVDMVFQETVMKLEDMGLIGERIAAQIAEKEAVAWNKGQEVGHAQGRTEEAREMAKRVLARRFGALPAVWAALIDRSDAEWCAALVERALEVESLAELEGGLN